MYFYKLILLQPWLGLICCFFNSLNFNRSYAVFVGSPVCTFTICSLQPYFVHLKTGVRMAAVLSPLTLKYMIWKQMSAAITFQLFLFFPTGQGFTYDLKTVISKYHIPQLISTLPYPNYNLQGATFKQSKQMHTFPLIYTLTDPMYYPHLYHCVSI